MTEEGHRAADRDAGGNASSRNWGRLALVSSVLIVLVLPLYAVKERFVGSSHPGMDGPRTATFVGRDNCMSCHEDAYRTWLGSDHDWAMDVAADSTVFGDFDDVVFEDRGVTSRFYRRDGKYFVHTQGPDGTPSEFEITHTFGYEPLQQYLVPFPDGRLQALSVAWDVVRGEWFHLYPNQDIPPDDWLHWTRGGQNWNGMCAECHSTNLQKNYDPGTGSFRTTWSEIDVSCEACHGPGSLHVEWAEIPPMGRPAIEHFGLTVATGEMSARQQVELCAPCHSRRSELGDYDHTGQGLHEKSRVALLDEGLYHADGQILEEVYVYGSFAQSKMYMNDIRCSDCHDVHSLKPLAEGNALCTQCHRAEDYDTYDHHFHQKIYEGTPSDGALCVKCHMPEQPYMVVDWRADHNLRIPRPDLTLEIGTPNACSQSGCHADRPAQWAAESFTKWYGKARRSHYGRTLHAGRRGIPDAQGSLVDLAADLLSPPIVRATALSLLPRYPGPKTGEALSLALVDPDPMVRYTAVANANVFSAREMRERLPSMLFDPVQSIRGLAASQLASLPRESLEPYQQQALDVATAEYIEAMEHSLDFPHAGHNLGNLYAGLGDPESARSHYERAIAIDDLFYPAKVNLALLNRSMGRDAEAVDLLQEVVSQNPQLHDMAYSLGLLLAELGRNEEAADALKRAAAGLPEVSRVQYNHALAEQLVGNDSGAETSFKRALELEPRNTDYLYALADFYVKRGRLRDALPLAETMIAVQPGAPVGHSLKAAIEEAMRSPEPSPAN